MRNRFLIIGTLVGTVVLFAWQTLSNAAIPWHMATMSEFASDSAAAHAIRAAAPQNGTWFSKYGVLAAVAITPDFADKTAGAAIVPMLTKQLVLDLLVTLAVVALLLRLPSDGVVATGVTLSLGALAVGAVMQFSDWNWYGFGFSYALVNVIDQAIAFFILGVTLAALRRRFGEPEEIRTAERPGIRAQSGLPASGLGTKV